MLSKQLLPADRSWVLLRVLPATETLPPLSLTLPVKAHDIGTVLIGTAGVTAQKCHKQPEEFLHSQRDLHLVEAQPLASLKKRISR